MKKVLLAIATMFSLSGCESRAQDSPIHDSTVKDFQLSRFLGSWYEIARIDHFFEKGMMFTQATYSLNEDGTVRVENCGYKKGRYKESVGKAKRPDPQNEPGLLRVSFFGPFYSDYRVLMVDPEYRYALISSKGPDYLWILSRENTVPPDTIHEILTVAEGCGFDISRLTWVTQIAE